MKRSIVAALAVLTGVASAQNVTVQQTYVSGSNDRYERPLSTVLDENLNVYVLSRGGLSGFTNRLTKYDRGGQKLWTSPFTNDFYDVANGLALDNSGDPIVVGHSYGKLLIVKFDTATGAATATRKSNPFNPARGIGGGDVVVDPVDDTIVIGGSIERGGDPDSNTRPYIAKFSNDGGTEIWRSAPLDLKGSITHMKIESGRVYVGGNSPENKSVYLGYIPVSGGTQRGFTPTPGETTYKELRSFVVVGDRVVWTAEDREFWSGYRNRLHYGQCHFPTSGTGSFTQFNESGWTYKLFTGLAYDSDSGQIGFQISGQPAATVQFMTIDPGTGAFSTTSTVEMRDGGSGLVPMGNGMFAAYTQGPMQHAFLVNPLLGVVSGTPYRTGRVGSLRSKIKSYGPYSTYAAGTDDGVWAVTLLYQPGPADDARTLREDTTSTTNILRNDPGVGAKTVGGHTQPSHAAAFSISSTGTAVYTPSPDFYGTDSFTYDEYLDGVYFATRSVTYTVLNVNDGPTAVDDEVGTVSNRATAYLGLMSNDLNPDGDLHPLRYLSTTQPSNGYVTLANDKTVLKIKAHPGHAGEPFTFGYTVQNGTGMTSTAVVTGTFAGLGP
ncbi:hypothetical protein EON81_08305 [bacterium]|nr:MAG: hypothetical protein EON81_08305 [bacterium]